MKKGFTLIELLVVIAIIAILAAILFPVFAQAREKARQTNCLSNCKQIGTAIQLYVDDYDETLPIRTQVDSDFWNHYKVDASPRYHLGFCYDRFPRNAGGDTTTECTGPKNFTWMDAIFPYAKNVTLFICPSVKISHPSIKNYGWDKNGWQPGYAMNHYLSQSAYLGGTDKNAQPCVSGHTTNSDGWPCVPSRTLTEIPNPGNTIFIVDATIDGISSTSPFTLLATSPYYVDAVSVWSNQNTAFSDCRRHLTGANFTFCDGHAKFYKRGQGPLNINCNPVDNSKPGNVMWNPDIK